MPKGLPRKGFRKAGAGRPAKSLRIRDRHVRGAKTKASKNKAGLTAATKVATDSGLHFFIRNKVDGEFTEIPEKPAAPKVLEQRAPQDAFDIFRSKFQNFLKETDSLKPRLLNKLVTEKLLHFEAESCLTYLDYCTHLHVSTTHACSQSALRRSLRL